MKYAHSRGLYPSHVKYLSDSFRCYSCAYPSRIAGSGPRTSHSYTIWTNPAIILFLNVAGTKPIPEVTLPFQLKQPLSQFLCLSVFRKVTSNSLSYHWPRIAPKCMSRRPNTDWPPDDHYDDCVSLYSVPLFGIWPPIYTLGSLYSVLPYQHLAESSVMTG